MSDEGIKPAPRNRHRTDAQDVGQIERMAMWRLPRGALSRQVLAMAERVERLEAEVARLRAERES